MPESRDRRHRDQADRCPRFGTLPARQGMQYVPARMCS